MADFLFIAIGLIVTSCVYALGVHMGKVIAVVEYRDMCEQDERRMMAVELEYKALREQSNKR